MSETTISGKVVEPYFPRHRERDIYVSLLQKTNPPAPDHLLKAALVRRAMTDVNRIVRLREDKPALQNLLQKGSIGDDLWASLLAAEKELEAEILETAAEANSFVEGWGQLIFQTATEMVHNEKTRAVLEQIGAQRVEKERRYGVKTKRIMPASSMPSSPMPAAAVPVPSPPPPATPVVVAPGTPVTPSSSDHGLVPPSTPGPESVMSSDGEGPASPRMPKSAKKSKKRK
ncbi:hypothetical protein PHLCEN_2v10116 [Hermanssonia centrifuga]|uniref:Uncharacterized protein n=1 Tax=Hermanssonia centrifuga TaxID=98765 RepID=A0A2R6NNY6_9APHY|nr:hypothetical protein PHLCEN_2v10116 [Hermanssonia centrifuga]